MIEPFTYSGLPSRVIFGSGTLARLPEEIDRLGLRRVMVLSTPQQHQDAQRVAARLDGRCAGLFAEATMHTPVAITERALAVTVAQQADGLVAIGGGSTTGLSKALAYRSGLPQIVVPTTYAGSEMTPILGETRDGAKTTLRSEKVLPATVIYDVDLTLNLPRDLTAASGMNAIAHAVEALYAQDRNPIVSLMAEEGIAALARALPRLMEQGPGDHPARMQALYGAWLCGACLGSVGMALHHKLCHVLGGMFDLPHAETHAILLPHSVAYNERAAPDAMKRIAHALGARSASKGLHQLLKSLPLPQDLRDIGMPESGIAQAARFALKNPYWNPAPLEYGRLRRLIVRAWQGEAPRAPKMKAADDDR